MTNGSELFVFLIVPQRLTQVMQINQNFNCNHTVTIVYLHQCQQGVGRWSKNANVVCERPLRPVLIVVAGGHCLEKISYLLPKPGFAWLKVDAF